MASGKKKVLVVDDDSFIRDVLAEILQAAGYEVDTAENGAQAFAKYTVDAGIGLIVSDMNSDVPIIIFTD